MKHLLFIVIATIMIVALVVVDRQAVQSSDGLTSVRFGMPLAWIDQDLSALSPPMPASVGIHSPWEHPTDVRFTRLAVNVVSAYLLLAVFMAMLSATWSNSASPSDSGAI